jgi:polysaccharide export outer membrane protein
MKNLFFCIIMLLLLGACVPNRKFTYVQKKDIKEKNLPVDTALRNYKQDQFVYRIQPNDALYIDFQSLTEDELDFLSNQNGSQGGLGQLVVLTSELVDQNGEITLLHLGKVKAAGLTVFELQDILVGMAAKYLESPTVKVRITNFRFTVLGEVETEGTYTTFNNRVNILEAIGLAGGMGQLAERSHVKIIRQKNGVAEVAYINLLDENLVASPYYFVHQNDVLVVSPLKQRPYRRDLSPNLAVIFSSLSLGFLIVNYIIQFQNQP